MKWYVVYTVHVIDLICMHLSEFIKLLVKRIICSRELIPQNVWLWMWFEGKTIQNMNNHVLIPKLNIILIWTNDELRHVLKTNF